MGKIIIYRNGQPHLDLVQRGKRTITSATQTKVILSDDSVSIKVSSNAVLDIAVNDYFEVFGDFYRINQPPTVKKNNERSYEYDIVGQGLMFDLLRCKFFNADGTGFKTTFDFPIIGNLEMFLTVVANNMHRFSDLWEVGTVANATETKTITFNSDTCLSALQKICQEFKTEFWIKAEGGKFKIHTGSFGSTLPVPFEYGKGKGLYSLSRNNVNEDGIINRLYVEGGSENIPADYRNFSDKLKFSDAGYIEDSALIAANGLKEGSVEFEDIYPHRTGVISAVKSLTSFSDSSMDFDLNEKEADGVTTKYLVAGQTAKMHFNKGNLAGYEFEITKYDHATKTFTIIPFDNGNGQVFPDSKTATFQFAVGDEYVLLDIVMPQTYIANAENQLLAKGTEQFNLLKQAKVAYDLDIAEDYLAKLQKLPEIGDLINVRDTALGIDKVIRVNEITRNFIENGEWGNFRYKVTIADTYEISFASQLVLQVQGIKNFTQQVQQQTLNLSRVGANATRDLKEMVFDTDGYFDATNIKPGSIETGMLNVGAQSQQISTNLVLRVNYDGPNRVKAGAFKVFSQALNREWALPAFETALPDDAGAYVYARVSKTGNTGILLITGQKLSYGDDPNDYRILMGMLASVTEGVRLFVPTYGTTQIVGGMIRTGRISSQDGTTFFDLDTGQITGNITFTAGAGGLSQVNGMVQAGNAATLTAAQQYTLGITNAQQANILSLQNKTDFLTATTIQGNAIATGTLMVGNGLGTNAGITGVGGNDDVFIWAGTDFQNRAQANFRGYRNGKMFLKSNTVVGSKEGVAIEDGKVVFRRADGGVARVLGVENGAAVDYGFNIYGNYSHRLINGRWESYYQPATWTPVYLVQIASATDKTISQDALKALVKALMQVSVIQQSETDPFDPYNNLEQWDETTVTLNNNYTGWWHDPDSNSGNISDRGMKSANNSLQNIPDGWYVWYGARTSFYSNRYAADDDTFELLCVFYENGNRLSATKTITFKNPTDFQ